MDLELKSKRALVTGGSRGIGKAIERVLARDATALAAAAGLTAEAVEAKMAAANSIHHLVDAAEVADVVAFLCSPRSRAINGDVIAAGGGAPNTIHC